MLNALKQHAFIGAVAIACFIHGTWTIATITGGQPPAAVVDLGSLMAWLFWVVPGALVSFALDIGQYRTAVEISAAHAAGRRPLGKYVTFVVISGFVYYLQWYHLIHHLPALTVAPSVASGPHGPVVALLSGFIVWIYPALLPITTLLYTLSHTTPSAPSSAAAPEVAVTAPPLSAASAAPTAAELAPTVVRNLLADGLTAASAAQPANRRRTAARKVQHEQET